MAWQYSDDRHTFGDPTFLDGASAFTTAAWFRPDDWASSDNFANSIQKENSYNPVTRNATNNYPYFQLWTSDTNPSANYGTGALSEGTWYHLAARWATTEAIETFLDGATQGSGATSSTGTVSSSANLLSVGGHESGSSHIWCSYAEIAFWDRKLTDAEIAALADGAAPLTNPSGMVFYFPCHRTARDVAAGIAGNDQSTTPTYVDHPRVYYPTSVQPMAAAGVSAAITGTAVAGGVTESEIVAGGETIIITLTGGTWVSN